MSNQTKTQNKPVAVLISDVHYNIQTLQVADAAMKLALEKADDLHVPLVIAGDLHDSKANLRGECVNAMLKTIIGLTRPYLLVGNHDKINEKSEEHSLNFLSGQTLLIDEPRYAKALNAHLIPYQPDVEFLKSYLKTIPPRSTLIMHQGIVGSKAGDYIQDKSAITSEDVAGHRVISGHYHTRQDIVLPDGGLWSYIGNPYTLGFGEANDPPKGFQVLYNDGSLEFIPTNLRKHVIWNETAGVNTDQPSVNENDLLWIKISGTKEQLASITKRSIPLSMPFRLDLIPIDTTTQAPAAKSLSKGELLDSLIDSLSNTSDLRKLRLKTLWKDLCE